MKPYYITCIKDGLFQPKTDEGANKPKAQWSYDERRVVNQDQRLKRIIISCLPDDIMKSVISYETAKDTWTDLVHSFDGPSNTKENRIMDLKLEYNTFRVKPFKSLSQTYTQYKTLLNELSNDGDFQEHFDDLVDERTSEEYLGDLDIEFHVKAQKEDTIKAEALEAERNKSKAELLQILSQHIGVLLEEKREEFGLYLKDDDVVPKLEDVSLVEGVLDSAFGGECDEDFAMGEGVLVSSSSLVMSTKSCVQGDFLGGMIVSLIFFEGLDEEAWVDAMDVLRFKGKR
ncbi:hypothetical protein Tco_1514490 [Tanacetum coccineum]